MRIDILTVFPEMFDSVLNTSILGRAREKGLIDVRCRDIRPYSDMKHKNTDDYPFGGGAGMLMTAQPIADCIRAVEAEKAAEEAAGEGAKEQEQENTCASPKKKCRRIYMSPRGVTLTQPLAKELAGEESLMILCGHYEGVDQRVIDKYIDMEISVGDYVLTGGEMAAMVLVDCVSRLIPGVLGSEESPEDESFSGTEGLLEYPQYTRPREFEGMEVPQVLLDGDHKKIARWRRDQSLLVTAQRRPELLKNAVLDKKDKAFLKENGYEV